MYYVYAYLRKDGSPYYIGKGKGNRAWNKRGHKVPLPKDKRRIVLMECNLTEVGSLALERFYIRWYGRKNLGTGILRNLTDGGEGASGRNVSDETKEKIVETLTGRTLSVVHKQKIRESALGRAFFEGKTHTKESKQKISNTKSKEWMITNPNGEVLKVRNLVQFCRGNNLSSSAMRQISIGNRNHHKGYKCKRVG
jgi:hypothetical protein